MTEKAKPRRRGRPAVPAARLEAFLSYLSETASIAGAAARAEVQRSTLYQLRKHDPEFAARWDEARKLGIDRLEDDAMRRALEGVQKPVFYAGRQIASVQQFNDRLLQFLLKAHKPEVYARPAAPPAAAPTAESALRDRLSRLNHPPDLARRVREAAARMEALGKGLPPLPVKKQGDGH